MNAPSPVSGKGARSEAGAPLLYQSLAERVAETISSGLLRPGERLLSVRQASKLYQLSPVTVLQAYYILEARGLIEARPRSGYYVRARIGSRLSEPEMSRPAAATTELDVSDFIFEILESVRDPDVAPLGSSFPSPYLFPLDRLARTLASSARHMDPRSTVRDLPPGNEELRRQIALRYLGDGADVSPAEIVVVSGAMEGLNLCLQAVCQPGDLIAIESPCFYGCLQAIERLGLKVVEIPTHTRDGIDLSALEDNLRRRPVKALLCMLNFQNPLGSVVPNESRRQLIDLLRKHDLPLIEDDVYAELYFGQRPLPSKVLDVDGRVMHVSSFAKCLAPGYRVGWVAAGRYAEKVRRLKISSSISTNIPAQAALAEYLKQGGYENHLRHLRTTLAAQEAAVVEEIERSFPTGTRLARPKGGYFLWVELPENVDAMALHRQALAQGISIAPGPIFSAKREYRNCIRINTGHPWSPQIATAIGTLAWLASR